LERLKISSTAIATQVFKALGAACMEFGVFGSLALSKRPIFEFFP
jgi:hypothetical protein